MGPSLAPSLHDVVAALTLDCDPYLSCNDSFDRLCSHVEQLATNRPGHPVMARHVLACPVCAEDVRFLLELVIGDLADAPSSGAAARLA